MDGASEWIDHPPVELSDTSPDTDLQGQTGIATKDQWMDDGTGGVMLGPPMSDGEKTALPSVLNNFTSHIINPHPGQTVLSGIDFDNNWTIWSHWLWADIYSDRAGVMVRPIVVLDDDGWAWRGSRESALKTQWEIENPGYFAIGLEWENEEVDGIHGSHSDRRIDFGERHLEASIIGYQAGTGDFPRREEYPIIPPGIPPDLLVEIRAPFVSEGTPLFPGLVPRYGGDATLVDLRWTPAAMLEAHDLGVLEVGPVPTPPKSIAFPDELFDERAVELDHAFQSWRHTRATVVWAIIDPRGAQADAIRLEFEAFVESITVVSTYQPPRYQIKWYRDDTTPYRRIHARKDSLTGGAGRVFPQSNAPQTSNRIGGSL